MVSANKFNAFVNNLATGLVNLHSDTLKVMLTNTAPAAANSVYGDISANDLPTSNGYTAGGATAALSSDGQSLGTYTLTLGNAMVTASGVVGPFRYAVLYDSSAATKSLIAWWDYGSSISLANTDTFTAVTGAILTLF